MKTDSMNIRKVYSHYTNGLNRLKDFPLLLMRIVLAYGFFQPAKMKWQDIRSIADWFGEMHIPAPMVSAYLTAGTEALGVMLLVLGLGTRFIVIPLIFLMLVAIKTVHWSNGFEAGGNGFEIPLYYIIMLLALLVYGAGRVSLDFWLRKRRKRYQPGTTTPKAQTAIAV